ncbi:hypothetical protein CDAR_497581 [Caerostris darwini]|uniref:CUB domain-containing protein n=1 Tax=Caerostris darwini TaxID=1538125 RepID=A0AAV4S4W9_9ARAC|nr:hypothetical protein CDAR_497581 [Caerostris darwini]
MWRGKHLLGGRSDFCTYHAEASWRVMDLPSPYDGWAKDSNCVLVIHIIRITFREDSDEHRRISHVGFRQSDIRAFRITASFDKLLILTPFPRSRIILPAGGGFDIHNVLVLPDRQTIRSNSQQQKKRGNSNKRRDIRGVTGKYQGFFFFAQELSPRFCALVE